MDAVAKQLKTLTIVITIVGGGLLLSDIKAHYDIHKSKRVLKSKLSSKRVAPKKELRTCTTSKGIKIDCNLLDKLDSRSLTFN